VTIDTGLLTVDVSLQIQSPERWPARSAPIL
jgi:hypothetical protein